jgi:hypothetical protein
MKMRFATEVGGQIYNTSHLEGRSKEDKEDHGENYQYFLLHTKGASVTFLIWDNFG